MTPGLNHLLGAFLFTAAIAVLAAPPQAEPGRQTAQEFRREIRTEHRLNYLLYVPKAAAAEPSKRWPLVLFLHGAGERGTNLNAVAVHGPPKLVAAGREFPFILASPQCPSGQVWNPTTLLALLDELQASLPVDGRRVYVTGLKQWLRGSFGSCQSGIVLAWSQRECCNNQSKNAGSL